MDQEKEPILRSELEHEIEIPIISKTDESLPVSTKVCCNSCDFSRHENNSLESKERSKSATKLCGLIIFYILVMIVEIFGGMRANSLAVITDAAHLLTDVAGFSISLFTVWAAGWQATSDQSYGYGRIEVLGAFLSVQLIWLISGFLIYEAVDRILHESSKINGMLMFVIAAFGFLINLIMVIWLGHHHTHHGCGDSHHNRNSEHNHGHHDHDHARHDHGKNEEDESRFEALPNINIQGAYLHVMADMIQSIGVMIAGGIIWVKPEWLVVDLICTLIFSVLALYTTLPMLRNIFGILMERTPGEIDIHSLENGLKGIKGVGEIHDLHVWSITVGKVVLSCHVVAEPGASSSELISNIRNVCQKRYNIVHVTIQVD